MTTFPTNTEMFSNNNSITHSIMSSQSNHLSDKTHQSFLRRIHEPLCSFLAPKFSQSIDDLEFEFELCHTQYSYCCRYIAL